MTLSGEPVIGTFADAVARPRRAAARRADRRAAPAAYAFGMRRLALAALLAIAGCSTTAPHTLGAAAINSALAVGTSAAQRSAGGCYATCTNGTV